MSQPGPRVPEGEFLPPRQTRVTRSESGVLEVEVGGERWHDVRLRLAFPLTPAERMVALLDADEQYLGTLRDFEELDPASRRLIEEELALQYFRPAILRIGSLRRRFGLIEMETETSAGPRLIRIRSARDDIRELGPGRFLLTDATGNRFEIPSLDALDPASQSLWHNLA